MAAPKRRSALLLTACICCATPARAMQPLVTDDTGTQGTGGFQIELTTEFLKNRIEEGGATTREKGSSTAATLSYGLAENVDLVAGIPWDWRKTETDGLTTANDRGPGDMEVEIKWRFLEPEGSRLSLALKPSLSLPTGNEEKGLGNGKVSGGLTLLATHQGNMGALYASIGYVRNEYRLESDVNTSRHDIWLASFASSLNLTRTIKAVGDIGVQTNTDKENGKNPAFILGGFILTPSPNLDLDLAIKSGLNDAETNTTYLAGATIRF